MGTDQRPLSKKKSWITTGALLFEIEGPACCAEEKGPACWVEETAMMVLPFFWLRSISCHVFHFWLDLFMAHFLSHKGCMKRSARASLFRGR